MIECDGVVAMFADIDADKYVDVSVVGDSIRHPTDHGDWGHHSCWGPQASDSFHPDGWWGHLKGTGSKAAISSRLQGNIVLAEYPVVRTW